MEPGGSENFDEKCLSSDLNSEESNSFELEENLWKRLKDERFKDGYKDGTFLGNEQALQKGFHFGYQQTIKQLFQMSKLKSVIEAAKEWICTPETGEELHCEYILLDKELNEDWKGFVEHLKSANISMIEDSAGGSDTASLPADRSEKLSENQASSESAGHEPSALCSKAEAASVQVDAERAKIQDTADEPKTVAVEESIPHEPSALRSEAEAASVQVDAERAKTQDTAGKLKTVVVEESIPHESIAAGVLLALKSECELNKTILDGTGIAMFNKYLHRLEQILGKI